MDVVPQVLQVPEVHPEKQETMVHPVHRVQMALKV